jgi:DNA ligase-1
MLATDADLTKLRFPLLASPKLDGVRAVVRGGVVYSRSNKPIPNKFVQATLGHLEHFDGELIVGEPTSKTVYRDTVSHVMSHDKTDFDVRFYVFDHVQYTNAIYTERAIGFQNHAHAAWIHTQRAVQSPEELLAYEEACLEEGYEGLILRDPTAPYKCGRSTVKEGYLLKLKRFTDAEFEVIGYEERKHNGNEATTNELGRTARSSHKAGKVGLGDLGALVLQGDGFTFSVGTGFDDATREALWKIRDSDLVGRLAKIKYFAVGMKTAPRHPVFLGWRDRSDT